MLVVCLFAVTVLGAPSNSPPPPSAVVFTGFYTFLHSTDVWQAPINVPQDGAWLVAKGANISGYMDCDHHYAATLTPNFSVYPSPLFALGTDPSRTEACLGNECFSCYTRWGALTTYTYYTTTNNPGFMPAGSGVVGVQTLNPGGTDNFLYLTVNQVNRNAMQSVSMFLARSEDDPIARSQDEIDASYFVANSGDRVPVVLEFLYGIDSFPAGPGLSYTATWDTGDVVVPEYNAGTRMPYGYSVLGVPVPKIATGRHKFTVTAKLPSGVTYTTPAMQVMVFAQTIYLSYGQQFDPKKGDDLLKFLPGSDSNGDSVDLRTGPQTVYLNIVIGGGSSGTFDLHLRDTTQYPGIAMNYPTTNADVNDDIDLGAGNQDQTQIAIPKNGKPKVVQIPLYVHDYGGATTVEVTMPYRKTSYIARRRIPIDDDANGLPDAGWKTAASGWITSTTLSASTDTDATAVGPGAQPVQLGDGFSSYEEYRGFFVQGHHERLDPSKRDLFIDADVDIDRSFVDTKLPYLRHYILPDESFSTDLPRFNGTIKRTAPVMNPTRSAKDAQGNPIGTPVPGAQTLGQRALRLVFTSDPLLYATKVDPNDNLSYPVWQFGIRAITWQDSMGIQPFDESQTTIPWSTVGPNKTRFVEVLARSESNLNIHMGATPSQPVYLDESGQPVPDCSTVPAGTPCDRFSPAGYPGLIFAEFQPAGATSPNRFILHSRLTYSGDYYTKLSFDACGSTTLQEVTQSDYTFYRSLVVGHEVGHNLALDHNSVCGSMPGVVGATIMYGTSPPNPRFFGDYLPYPTQYQDFELGLMRTHQ